MNDTYRSVREGKEIDEGIILKIILRQQEDVD
jgi:hypothetical protein